MAELSAFRSEARAWLEGGTREPISAARRRWFDACYERGWTVPSWPKAYGGAGLDPAQHRALRAEMAAIGAPAPLTGMGVSMIGPTLLEFGNEAQRAEHLPKVASGQVRWCQGYSEPGAGSDLASLKTRAEDRGDYYLING